MKNRKWVHLTSIYHAVYDCFLNTFNKKRVTPPFKVALGRHDFPISNKSTVSQ